MQDSTPIVKPYLCVWSVMVCARSVCGLVCGLCVVLLRVLATVPGMCLECAWTVPGLCLENLVNED